MKSKRVIIVDIDGCREDVFKKYVNWINENSAIRRISKLIGGKDKEYYLNNVFTIFPSVTFAAQASIFTGLLPGKHRITGNNWFDKDTERLVNYISISKQFKIYNNIGDYNVYRNSLTTEHLRNVKTLYDYASSSGFRSIVSFNMYGKGVNKKDWIKPSKLQLGKYPVSSKWYDKTMIDKTIEYLGGIRNKKSMFDILTIYFAGHDHESHKKGTGVQLQYLKKNVNNALNQLVSFLEEKEMLESCVFIFTSDHGQTDRSKFKNIKKWSDSNAIRNVTRYLQAILEKQFKYHIGKNIQISYNVGLLHIFLMNSSNNQKQTLENKISLVKKIVEIDGFRSLDERVIENIIRRLYKPFYDEFPDPSNRIRERKREARLRKTLHSFFNLNRMIRKDIVLIKHKDKYQLYDPKNGLKDLDSSVKKLNKDMPKDYLKKIVTGLHCDRSGDIILFPRIDKEFFFNSDRIKYDPNHAEHGTFSIEDMKVPLYLVGTPLENRKIIKRFHYSILDIVPSVSKILGFKIGKVDGESFIK